MKTSKILLLCLMALFITITTTACGDDDKDTDIDRNALAGRWECTDCDVTEIKSVGGLELPEFITDMIEDQLEDDMIGSVQEISADAKLEGNVLILPGSGIKWTILNLTDDYMKIQYNTSNSAGNYGGIEMTVIAEFKKL